MTAENKHIDKLIARYLSGEASVEERLKLEQWIDESEINKKYFSNIRIINTKAAATYKTVKVDTEKAWDKVKQQMNFPAPGKSTTIVQTPSGITRFIKVAAVFIILLGLSFLIYKIYLSSSGKAQTFIVESNDSTLNYILSDSTCVALGKNSNIIYNSQYGLKQREVTVSGEAFFNVVHNPEKPFIVIADGVLVMDLGTSFIVRAFPDRPVIEVFVESGKVLFYTARNPGIELEYGEAGVFEKTSGIFRKYTTLPNNMFGTNRFFEFRREKLSDVIEILNTVYGIDIRLSNDSLGDYNITVTFDNENIDTILEIIAETLGLQVSKTTNGYSLEKGSYNDR